MTVVISRRTDTISMRQIPEAKEIYGRMMLKFMQKTENRWRPRESELASLIQAELLMTSKFEVLCRLAWNRHNKELHAGQAEDKAP